tara:strand:- start:878 stop:1765 length:888 start_codon:yes stop_codon:yes gene_type:complete
MEMFLNNSKEMKKAFREKSLNCSNDNEFNDLMNMFQNNNNIPFAFNGPSIAVGVDLQSVDMPDLKSMINLLKKSPQIKQKCRDEIIQMEQSGMKDLFKSMSSLMGANFDNDYENIRNSFFDEDDSCNKIEEIIENITPTKFKFKINIKQLYNGFNLYDLEDTEILKDERFNIKDYFVKPGELNIKDVDGCYEINFEVLPDDCFEYKDGKLHYNISISLKDSLCGFTFKIKHPNDKEYTIQNYNRIIKPYSELSIPELGINKENLIIKFFVNYPDRLEQDVIDSLELLFNERKISN